MGLPREYYEDWVDIPNNYVRDFGEYRREKRDSEIPPEIKAIVEKARKDLGLDKEMSATSKETEKSNPSDQPNQNDDIPEMMREKDSMEKEPAKVKVKEFETNMKDIRNGLNDVVNGKRDNAEEEK